MSQACSCGEETDGSHSEGDQDYKVAGQKLFPFRKQPFAEVLYREEEQLMNLVFLVVVDFESNDAI